MSTASTISTSQRNAYPVFLEDRLLTAGELNDLFTYLDRQNRDTRVFGVGVGVLSGLELAFEGGKLIISKGVGISSDGQLFHMTENCTLSRFESYEIPGKAFNCEASPEEQVYSTGQPVLKLYEGESGNLFSKEEKNQSYYVVLYRKLLKSNTGGSPQIKCLKSSNNSSEQALLSNELLLIKPSVYQQLQKEIEIDFEEYDLSDSLPTPFIDGIGRKDESSMLDLPKIQSVPQLFAAYTKTVSAATQRILEAYNFIYAKLASLLELEENPFTELEGHIHTQIDKYAETPKIQYVYDYLKDLIAAYQELVETYRQLFLTSGDNISKLVCKHPNHVVLGSLVVNGGSIEVSSERRSVFINPLPEGISTGQIERLRFLFNRMDLLAKKANLDLDPDGNKDVIKITPSMGETETLSRRALPFYYKDQNQNEELKLRNNWNFNYRNQPKLIPGYELSLAEDPFKQPLLHGLAKYPFLRIEGHLGKLLNKNVGSNGEGVLEELQRLRLELNLPFDIYCLKLGTVSEALYSIFYQPLQREYAFELAELNRVLLLKGDLGSGLLTFLADKTELKNFTFPIFKDLFEKIFKDDSPYYYLLTRFEQLSLTFEVLDPLDKVQEEFSTFAECFPGLEHLAGVPQGGTFFLVYDGQFQVVGDFALPYTNKNWKLSLEEFTKGASFIFSPRGSYCKKDAAIYSLVGHPKGGSWKLTNEAMMDITSKLVGPTASKIGFKPIVFEDTERTLTLTYYGQQGPYVTSLVLANITSFEIAQIATNGWEKNVLPVTFTGTIVAYKGDIPDISLEIMLFIKPTPDQDWDLISNARIISLGEDKVGFEFDYVFEGNHFPDSKARSHTAEIRVEVGPCSESEEVLIPVPPKKEEPAPPKAEIEVEQGEGEAYLTVKFDASKSTASNKVKIVEYEWDFGDTQKDSGIQASHTYEQVGEFEVQLQVTDNRGKQNIARRTISLTEASSLFEKAKKSKKTIVPTADSVDSTALFETRQNAYDDQLKSLGEDASFLNLAVVKKAQACMAISGKDRKLDDTFLKVAKTLVVRMKPGESRLAQYQTLLGVLVGSYLDKKLQHSKDVISPELQMGFRELKKKSEDRKVNWKEVQKVWKVKELADTYEKELLNDFLALFN